MFNPASGAFPEIAGVPRFSWPSHDWARGRAGLRAAVRAYAPDVVFIPTARWFPSGFPTVTMVRNMEPLVMPCEGNPPAERVRNLMRRREARRRRGWTSRRCARLTTWRASRRAPFSSFTAKRIRWFRRATARRSTTQRASRSSFISRQASDMADLCRSLEMSIGKLSRNLYLRRSCRQSVPMSEEGNRFITNFASLAAYFDPNTRLARRMLKHPANKTPAEAGEGCFIICNRLVYEAHFARCLSIWQGAD